MKYAAMGIITGVWGILLAYTIYLIVGC